MSSVSSMNPQEVLEFVKKSLNNKGTPWARDKLVTSFERHIVNGEQLVSLCMEPKGPRWRMQVYGVPSVLRSALVEAVKATKAKRKPRGKPRFVGKRKTTLPSKKKSIDLPAVMARNTYRAENKYKKSFDAYGWPEVEIFVSKKPRGCVVKPTKPISRQIPKGRYDIFARNLEPEIIVENLEAKDVFGWLLNVLGETRRTISLAKQLYRMNVDGKVLAGLRSRHQLASYGVPTSLRKPLLKAIKKYTKKLTTKKAPVVVRAPSGNMVRNSVVAMSKHMRIYESNKPVYVGAVVSIPRCSGYDRATVLEQSGWKSLGELVLVRYASDGKEEWVTKASVQNVLYAKDKRHFHGVGTEYFPWDGEVLTKRTKKLRQVVAPVLMDMLGVEKIEFKDEVLSRSGSASLKNELPYIGDFSAAQVKQWVEKTIAGREGKRAAKLMAAFDGKYLVQLAAVKNVNSIFSSIGIQYNIRRRLVKSIREEVKSKKKDESSVPERKSTVALTITMPTGDVIRNSDVSFARYLALKSGKKAYKTGFPDFEFVHGARDPVYTLDNTQLTKWISKRLKNEKGLQSVVSGLTKNRVTGEALANVCVSKNRNASMAAFGIPLSMRKLIISVVRKDVPNYRAPLKKTNLVRAPNGKMIRNSSVSFAKAMRFENKDYQPKRFPDVEFVFGTRRTKFTMQKKKVQNLKTNLPKLRKKVLDIDEKGWPEIQIILPELQRSIHTSKPEELDTAATEMWLREKLGSAVGIKALVARLRKLKGNGKFLQTLAGNKKERNAIMATYGIPLSMRKPLVSAVRKAFKDTDPKVQKKWIGNRMITLPGSKVQIRDSTVSIDKHFKLKSIKKEKEECYGLKMNFYGLKVSATAFKKQGWPSIVQVFKKEELNTDVSFQSLPKLNNKKTVQWMEQKFGKEVTLKSAVKSMKKYKVNGATLVSVAHDRKRDYRYGMYGIPFSMRTNLTTSVKKDVPQWSEQKRRRHITVEGEKIRDSVVSLFLHQRKNHNVDKINKECVPALLEMTPSEVGVYILTERRATWNKLERKYLASVMVDNKVSGKMLAELGAVKKGRGAKMASYGVPTRMRSEFVKLAKSIIPPQYKEPETVRFVGMGKVKLPTTGKEVRDSAVSIDLALNRKNQRLKKKFNEHGWPKHDLVERKAQIATTELRNVKDMTVAQVEDWATKKFGKFLGSRLARNKISGRTLVKIARSRKPALSLRVLGVSKSFRREFILTIRKAVGPERNAIRKHTHWYSDSGSKARNTHLSVAVCLHKENRSGLITKEMLRSLHLESMSTAQVGYWLNDILKGFPGVKNLVRRFAEAKVDGASLRRIVGNKGTGRSHRLSCYGVPKSLRCALVKAVNRNSQKYVRPEKATEKKIVAPGGKKIRDSVVSFARHMAGNKTYSTVYELFVSKHVPLLKMENDTVCKWVEETIVDKENIQALQRNLKRFNVNGLTLASIAKIRKDRPGRFAAYGVPHSLRTPLVQAVKKETKGFGIPRQQVPKWVGRSFTNIDHEVVRDSAVAVAAHMARSEKRDIKKEIVFVTKEPVADKLDNMVLKTVVREKSVLKNTVPLTSYPKMEDWLKSKLTDISSSKLESLIASMKKNKATIDDLIKLGKAKRDGISRSALLARIGVPRSLRKAVVQAVNKDFKDSKTPTKSPKRKIRSKLREFRKAKEENKSKKAVGWPDIEFVYNADAVKGGKKKVVTVIKAAEDFSPYKESGCMPLPELIPVEDFEVPRLDNPLHQQKVVTPPYVTSQRHFSSPTSGNPYVASKEIVTPEVGRTRKTLEERSSIGGKYRTIVSKHKKELQANTGAQTTSRTTTS